MDTAAKWVLIIWVFLHTRDSVLLATLLHATTNLFAVSPVVAEVGGVALPLLVAVVEWYLVVVTVSLSLTQGQWPGALPEARCAANNYPPECVVVRTTRNSHSGFDKYATGKPRAFAPRPYGISGHPSSVRSCSDREAVEMAAL